MHPTTNLNRKALPVDSTVLQIPPTASGVKIDPQHIPCLTPPMSKYYANNSIQTKLKIDSNFLVPQAPKAFQLFSQYLDSCEH